MPITSVALGVWAGVSLGGALVAAPAKFRAPSLDLSTALEVGRAQFYWVGVTEALLCGVVLLSLLAAPTHSWKWSLAPVLLFVVQRLAIMPALDQRTLQIITGSAVGDSRLHIWYIVIEATKFLALTLAAFFSARALIASA